MLKHNIESDDIYEIVAAFRSAISAAKYNDEFSSSDRMSRFPNGCCDDACDLLAYYLYKKYGVHTQQGNGVYDDGNFYNLTNHAWLIMDDNTIIDITGNQFESCAGFAEKVYIGNENDFYRHLERKQIFENCDITQNKRLWNDYLIIMRYLLK